MIAINEIFYSVQGEGTYAGTPMVFVRVAGCNLACSWCDQPDTIHEGFTDRNGQSFAMKYEKMYEAQILAAVEKFPARRVCLTGGEPTVHKLDQLVGWLRTRGCYIHMETNGTNFPEWAQYVDHICVSPKREAKVHHRIIEYAHEFKFIVDEHFELAESEAIRQKCNSLGQQFYLQPCNYQNTWHPGMLEKTMKLVHENPSYRLSLQLHKILGVR